MNRTMFSLALAAGLMISPLAASAQQTYPTPNNPNIPNYSYPAQGQDDEQQDEPMQPGQQQYPPQQDPNQPGGTPYQYPQQQQQQYAPQGQYAPGQYAPGQYAPGQYAPGQQPPAAAASADPVARAIQQTQRARRELRKIGDRDLAGHRAQAQALLDQAIQELKACQYYETH